MVENLKKQKKSIKFFVESIKHEEYINVLFNKKMMRHKMKRIQSKLHRIGTYDVCQIYLSCFKIKDTY